MVYTNEKDFENGFKKEWLITNGIGGYAMSSINGLNTRKYHALLVAALGKSFERFVVLPKINEEVFVNKSYYSISTNECPNFVETGYKFQKLFARDLLPEFYYNVYGVEVLKKISMQHGENKVAIVYTVKSNNNNVKLKLSPLVNYRNFHTVKSMYYAEQEEKNGCLKIALNSSHNLYIKASCGKYTPYYNTYYQNMYYREEAARGFEALESHFMPGFFEIEIGKNSECVIEVVASVDDKFGFEMKSNANQIIKSEETRLQKYIKIANANSELEKDLVVASDQFIIEKKYGKTIIAGYPWFGDWGRDTFISLEGLLLKTNRFNDAKEIIKSFVRHIKNGLVPNLIDENGGQSYNSVDGSLWYINAVYKYYKYTHDLDFVNEMYPILMNIFESYKNGTLYNIKMDDDGLLKAGDETTQLTWMDAKIGDYIPTPRYGKAVEINALWYNAINILKLFSDLLNVSFYDDLIEQVKNSFDKFSLENGLYDTIEPYSSQIRPNQLFAVSLDFSPLSNEKSNEILDLIEKELLTSKGLRTLSPSDENYKSRYEGDSFERDSSYHQGTVWPWLIMEYYDACIKLKRKPKILVNVKEMLEDRCIGNVSEIYDADEPREAKGAVAQAWSIAALM